MMKEQSMEELLSRFNRNAPASDSAILAFEQKAGIHLPAEYVDFLKVSNGGEGFIGENSYLIVWKLEELQELNAAYEVNTYAPGLLLFGSDGGGEGFAFDMEASCSSVVRVPFVGMDRELMRPIATSFVLFLEALDSIE